MVVVGNKKNWNKEMRFSALQVDYVTILSEQTSANNAPMPDTALVEAHDLLAVPAPPLASTKLPTDAYVLSTAVLPDFYAASTSPPSNAIHLLDKTSLRTIRTLPGHSTATTALRSALFTFSSCRDALISTGKDGTVKIWDDRSPTHRTAAITSEPILFPPTHHRPPTTSSQ